MRRPLKLISLLLIASMALSVCACDTRRKGVEPEQLDEYEKPEHSVETVLPEPTETAPTTPEPDPTTPEPTATPTNTPKPIPDYQPLEIKNTIELIRFAEGALGMDYEEATVYLTKSLSISTFTPKDSFHDTSKNPSERFLRYMDKDIVVDGITYKSIGMHMQNGKVLQVNFTPRAEPILAKDESIDSKKINETLSKKIKAEFGDPIKGYKEDWIDFSESGVTGWYDGEYLISLFWGKSCQSKKGNDQLVLEITYPGDISTKTPTGRGNTGNTGNTDPSSTSGLTSDYVYVMSLLAFGKNLSGAQTALETCLMTTLGSPSEKKSSDKSYTVYTYSCDLTIDGVKYDQIDLYVGSKGIVYNVVYTTAKNTSDYITEYFKSVEGRFKTLIGAPAEETSDPGNKYVTRFKVADNIDLTVTADLKGNDSRCSFNLEDKTQK